MSVAAEVGAALGRRVARLRPVGGGDLNDAFAAELDDGSRVFVKAHDDPPPGSFAAEAAGLAWLADAGGLPTPGILAHGERWLALEWIDSGALGPGGEEALGQGLAVVHRAGAGAHGAAAPGTPPDPGRPGEPPPVRIGPIALPGAPRAAWAETYAEDRLRPLAARAAARGALPPGAAEAIDRVCDRMEELAGPPEPPSRLHGDLWAGNVLAGRDGLPRLIDPAAHGGHRETDLALLRLFGGPSERCFAAYAEAAPLPEGHAERTGLWQLQPLLVHAVLFGPGYGAAVARTAARYA